MGYIMDFFVDGGCRPNGNSEAIGAAAAVMRTREGAYTGWTRTIHNPTSQRAELGAVILALEQALIKNDELRSSPRLEVTIHSDSMYVVNCMNVWADKWERNGWRNSVGEPVANAGLIQEALDLSDQLSRLGRLAFVWISRKENRVADRMCEDAMDGAEREIYR